MWEADIEAMVGVEIGATSDEGRGYGGVGKGCGGA